MTDFIDFATFKRPKTPNTYFLAPIGFTEAARPDANSPQFDEAPKELFNKALALIQDAKNWGDIRSDETSLRIAFIARTALLRFKDDVDIAVLDGESGGSRIAIYSRSRLGKSDFGANRKRVAELIHTLTSN